jgi:hypothetical protein
VAGLGKSSLLDDDGDDDDGGGRLEQKNKVEKGQWRNFGNFLLNSLTESEVKKVENVKI